MGCAVRRHAAPAYQQKGKPFGLPFCYWPSGTIRRRRVTITGPVPPRESDGALLPGASLVSRGAP
jgi:hypothetical protein